MINIYSKSNKNSFVRNIQDWYPLWVVHSFLFTRKGGGGLHALVTQVGGWPFVQVYVVLALYLPNFNFKTLLRSLLFLHHSWFVGATPGGRLY